MENVKNLFGKLNGISSRNTLQGSSSAYLGLRKLRKGIA
jgi:hypothetical protein